MYFTTHLILGGALGSLARSVPGAALLGLGSHALADMLPHRDYSSLRSGLWDLAVGLSLLAGARKRGASGRAMAGALAGALPDLEVALSHVNLWPFKSVYPSHSGALPHGRTGRWPGLALQAGLVGLGLLILEMERRGPSHD